MPAPKRFTAWRKSSHSGSDNDCVEVGRTGPAAKAAIIAVRDTKHRGEGPVLEFSAADWRSFLTRVRNGGDQLQ